ncbi:MFS transporter [Undibacterium sp.]|jgi:CP family cyanate transporter-like MFS transporter|uniref:CynX/NimT family MFS transporter n=1 Tax=Undibacterium sp. TaxID=1914977 RepID=UPI002BEF2992|nr:MFS transporter [Undibacterium sp.]HTD04337.1 MFS transporter [Undibacterium sp.]
MTNRSPAPPMLDKIDIQAIDAEIDSVPPPAPTGSGSRSSQILLGASLVLIAFNLRPVFSSLSVLLPEIMTATGLSSASASLLTTLPVLCLGLFAPLAPMLARRFGAERTLLGMLILLAAGTAMRGLASIPLLFFATGLAGGSIAVGNVLLPGLVKRDFPNNTALMMGLYTMSLCAGAAGAAGLTVPMEKILNNSWPMALAVWSLPAIVIALMWAPQALASTRHAQHSGFTVQGLWRDPLAWKVTLFMGLQSALAYCVFGWLAPILRSRGMDGVTAGLAVSVSVMFQVATCLLVPPLAFRCKNQRLINTALTAIAVTALVAMTVGPISGGWIWLWAGLQGVGQGGLFAAAMTVIVLRSPDAHIAAHLSSMSQAVGYTLAATGPLMVGLLHSWTGNHHATAILFIALGAGAALFGVGAGRAGLVNAKTVAA